VSFDRPWALLALVPALAVFAMGARAWTRSRTAPSPLRLRLALGVELALLVVFALLAAGPRVVQTSRRLAVVMLIDRSRSTDHVADYDRRLRTLLDEAPRSMGRDDLLGVVSFALEADTATTPSPASRSASLPLPRAPSTRDETDLAAAIVHGLGDLPADASGRLVLVSDGDETRGDARAAALLASAAGVPIDVVTLSRPPRSDVAAVRLRSPERVEVGAPVDLALVLRSTRASRGRIELLRDGVRVGATEAQWGAGEDVVHLRDEARAPGLHRYEARVIPAVAGDDEVIGNEAAAGFVRVAGASRAVVISGARAQGGGEALAGALRSVGMEVDLVGPTSAPATAGEWGRYDLIALDDVRARDLDPAALGVIREQVRELGAGLLMAGSDRAFGPGGYGQSPVEEVLPVTLDLRQHRMRGSVALAVMIDRSGSMGASTRDGRTKIDLANEGAARSAAMLAPADMIAIGHVDTETTWTWPMHTANDPTAIARAARSGTAGGGGIATEVALRDAYAALGATRATIRHVILLADGDDAEESERCAPLSERAMRDHITTSVVAIGRGHDEANLERIARIGGGRYYLTEDARTLPAIFTEETVVAARNPMREEPFTPRFLRSAEALRGVDASSVPAVQGYVITERRARAEVLARALDDDPWLARWQIGVGRSAVITSDLDGRWTRAFLAWPGASAMIAQVGAWLARGVHDGGVRVGAVASRGRLRVEVDATTDTGRWDSALDLEARVVSPSGASVRVPLEARAPGRYEAELEASRSGSYLVTVVSPASGVVGVTGAEVTASSEITALPGNPSRLIELADRTGGRVRTHLRDVFAGLHPPHRSSRPITRALLYAALALLLCEVIARRAPTPDLTSLRAWWARRRATSVTSEPVAVASEGALAMLRARREAAQHATPAAPIAAVEETREAVTASETASEAKRGDLDALVAKKRAREKR
jgi:Ca-activated chloride channel homolog